MLIHRFKQSVPTLRPESKFSESSVKSSHWKNFSLAKVSIPRFDKTVRINTDQLDKLPMTAGETLELSLSVWSVH